MDRRNRGGEGAPAGAGRLAVVDADDPTRRAQAHELRRAVFVEEQGVPVELEFDGRDDACALVLAVVDGRPVGTARSRQTREGFKLERVAVAADARGRGVGAAMVHHLLRDLPPRATSYVHAQESAVPFWEAMGFVAEGPPFHEAGIPHRAMRRPPPG